MFIYLKKKAQSTAEYVIVLGLVVGAVVAMQTYVKRNLQSRVRQATDHAYTPAGGIQVNFTTRQYEPYYTSSNFTTSRSSSGVDDVSEDGGGVNRQVTEEYTSRTGNQFVESTAGSD